MRRGKEGRERDVYYNSCFSYGGVVLGTRHAKHAVAK